jgi:ASC-1-like (ASCH) protein
MSERSDLGHGDRRQIIHGKEISYASHDDGARIKFGEQFMDVADLNEAESLLRDLEAQTDEDTSIEEMFRKAEELYSSSAEEQEAA